MTLCTTCGNEISERDWKCPFCESFQYGSGSGPSKAQIVTVNLKFGQPTVSEAMEKLRRELVSERQRGVRVIKLVHGYGSNGTGGSIKIAVRRDLVGLKKRKMIRDFLPGEEYSKETNKGSCLLRAYPGLRSSLRSDTQNRGITFVEL